MGLAEEIRIGASENVDRVRDRLRFEMGFLAQQGLKVVVTEDRRGNTTFFVCRLEGDSSNEDAGNNARADRRELLRHHLANALSDLIVNDWERNLLNRMIKSSCEGLSAGEQSAIFSAASRSLDCRTDGRPDLLRRVNRKGRVLRTIMEYLSAQEEVNIDGFITFRLQDYREQLSDAVGRAVDDFLMEKEYLEFVSLLKYFVEAQESKLKLVHVVILPKRGFRLVDDKGVAINNESLAESFPGLEMEINPEDLLVSALITIAPERVVLHCPPALDRMEYLETIKSVFEGRITVCRGCNLCRAQRKEPGTRARSTPGTGGEEPVT